MDVIEYELDWRDQAHKAEIEELKKEISAKNQENAQLKAILIENGIDF